MGSNPKGVRQRTTGGLNETFWERALFLFCEDDNHKRSRTASFTEKYFFFFTYIHILKIILRCVLATESPSFSHMISLRFYASLYYCVL